MTDSSAQYKVPKASLLKDIVITVLKNEKIVDSQKYLLTTVKYFLRNLDGRYTVTSRRLRKVIFTIPEISVEIDYKYTERELGKKCPVCYSEMKPVYNMTIDNNKVLSGYRCTHCSYWTGLKRRVPRKYRFIYLPPS